jgi:hypothetical protein
MLGSRVARQAVARPAETGEQIFREEALFVRMFTVGGYNLSHLMKPAPARDSWSAERRALVELMRRIWYGKILNLEIRNGEPVLVSTTPRVIREWKFGANNGALAGRIEDFLQKDRVHELFSLMDRLENGVILWLEIQEGLPFRMGLFVDAA